MKKVLVLGSGCRRCSDTAETIVDRAKALGVPIELEKVTDMAVIVSYGVMATPGVVVDGKVVHAGGLPTAAQIDGWLQA